MIKNMKIYVGKVYMIKSVNTKLYNSWTIKTECEECYCRKTLLYLENNKYMYDIITGQKHLIDTPMPIKAKIGQTYVKLPLKVYMDLEESPKENFIETIKNKTHLVLSKKKKNKKRIK